MPELYEVRVLGAPEGRSLAVHFHGIMPTDESLLRDILTRTLRDDFEFNGLVLFNRDSVQAEELNRL